MSVIIVVHMVSEIYFSWSENMIRIQLLFHCHHFIANFYTLFLTSLISPSRHGIADSLAINFDFLFPVKSMVSSFFQHFGKTWIERHQSAKLQDHASCNFPTSFKSFDLFFFLFPRPSCSVWIFEWMSWSLSSSTNHYSWQRKFH